MPSTRVAIAPGTAAAPLPSITRSATAGTLTAHNRVSGEP